MVASALLWAGGVDVLECRTHTEDGDDPELEAATTLFPALHRLGRPVSAGEMIRLGYDLTQTNGFGEPLAGSLEMGRAAYGERSFAADPVRLFEEIQAELLDVCGWGYVLHQRLECARQALIAATPEPSTSATPPAETRDQVLARRAAAKAERSAAIGSVREAITRLHPGIEARKLDGLIGDVLAVQRGVTEPLVRDRVLQLLGARHPLLAGVVQPKPTSSADRNESRRTARAAERSVAVEFIRQGKKPAPQRTEERDPTS